MMNYTAMSNEQLMDQGNRMMDDTDQAIERGKRVGLYLLNITILLFQIHRLLLIL